MKIAGKAVADQSRFRAESYFALRSINDEYIDWIIESVAQMIGEQGGLGIAVDRAVYVFQQDPVLHDCTTIVKQAFAHAPGIVVECSSVEHHFQPTRLIARCALAMIDQQSQPVRIVFDVSHRSDGEVIALDANAIDFGPFDHLMAVEIGVEFRWLTVQYIRL